MNLVEYTQSFSIERNLRKVESLNTKIKRAETRQDRFDGLTNRLTFKGRVAHALSKGLIVPNLALKVGNRLRGGDFDANGIDERNRLNQEKVDYLKARRDKLNNQIDN